MKASSARSGNQRFVAAAQSRPIGFVGREVSNASSPMRYRWCLVRQEVADQMTAAARIMRPSCAYSEGGALEGIDLKRMKHVIAMLKLRL
jgi:hypothetical protein